MKDWTGKDKKKTPKLYRDFQRLEQQRKEQKARADAVKPAAVKDRVRYPNGRSVIAQIPLDRQKEGKV